MVYRCCVTNSKGDRGTAGERGRKGEKGNMGDPGTAGEPVSTSTPSIRCCRICCQNAACAYILSIGISFNQII